MITKLLDNEWKEMNIDHVKYGQTIIGKYCDNFLPRDKELDYVYTAWGNKALAAHFLEFLKEVHETKPENFMELVGEYTRRANHALDTFEFLTFKGYEGFDDYQRNGDFKTLTSKQLNQYMYGEY